MGPVLVIPVSVELESRPDEHKLVVTDARAELFLGESGGQVRMSEVVRITRRQEGLWASHASTTIDHLADFRFALNGTQVRLLDVAAAQESRTVALTLKCETDVAWVSDEYDLQDLSVRAVGLAPLPWIRVAEATLRVPRSEWSEHILPGLGLDSMRLVAVRLPRSGVLNEDLVAWFDQARLKFDAGDYRGAIERARDVRNAVEGHLGATRQDPVASKVQAARQLPDHAPVTEFVDGVWQALANVTNEAHHADYPDQLFIAADARAVLLSTAVMLEYLASALSPGAL